MSTDTEVFDFLKKKSPGDSLEVSIDGRVVGATLVRRGRQNARLKLTSSEELYLAPLSDILVPQSLEKT